MNKLNKKLITLFILAIICISGMYANSNDSLLTSNSSPTVSVKETPQWLKDLRDTEIITIGAMPFITLGVSLTYSLIVLFQNNFNTTYFVNPFAKSGSYSTEEQIGIIVTSSLICVGIGLTNLTINLVKRGIEKKNNQNDLQDNVKITVIENELNVIPVPAKYTREKNYLYGTMENAVF